MTVTTAYLTNSAFGYPTRGATRRHTPHILAVVHQTATTPYDGQAMALRNQRNGAGYVGNTATYYVDQDGDAVHAVDGTKYASWCSAPSNIAYVDATRASIATVKQHFASGFNPNECVWEQLECVGTGSEPWSEAQFEFAAWVIAARSKLCGLPISRETVVPHRDFDTVNRPSDPWPAATREARMAKLIARAKVLAGGTDMLAVVTRTPFPEGPRKWVVAPSTLNGYDPKQPGKVVKSATFTSPSSARANAEVSVAWPGTTTPPVPNGGPFLEVTDGTFAGLLIVKALVTLDPAPVVIDQTPFSQADVDAKVAAAIAADRAKAHVDWS